MAALGPPLTRRDGMVPPSTCCQVVAVIPEQSTVLTGFATWLEAGNGAVPSRARHLRDVQEFLVWYDVNHHDDVATAARRFGEYGSHHQAASMRLLLEWLATV